METEQSELPSVIAGRGQTITWPTLCQVELMSLEEVLAATIPQQVPPVLGSVVRQLNLDLRVFDQRPFLVGRSFYLEASAPRDRDEYTVLPYLQHILTSVSGTLSALRIVGGPVPMPWLTTLPRKSSPYSSLFLLSAWLDL